MTTSPDAQLLDIVNCFLHCAKTCRSLEQRGDPAPDLIEEGARIALAIAELPAVGLDGLKAKGLALAISHGGVFDIDRVAPAPDPLLLDVEIARSLLNDVVRMGTNP